MSFIKTNKRPSPKIGMRFGMLKITGIAGKDKWRDNWDIKIALTKPTRQW